MSQFNVTFMPDNVSVQAAQGESLIDVAARADLHINASCGGEGVCGRCRVNMISGELKSEPGLYLSSDEYAEGVRLACRSYIISDVKIDIPLESRADATVYAMAKAEAETTADTLDPMVTELEVALTAPSKDDNVGDYDRLMTSLAQEHGLVEPEMTFSALMDLPDTLRAGDFKAKITIFADPPHSNPEAAAKSTIIGVKPSGSAKKNYGLALDVGTTTVWAKLIDLETGENAYSFGDLNGQISFGEDVISRIVYAGKGDGLHRLKEKVIENINSLIDRLEEKEPGSQKAISLVTVAGNTTMSHLLTGLNPKSIRLAPYVPVAASWPTLNAADLGIKVGKSTPLLIYPSVSSYVGGDIVAGVIASKLYKESELTLFIDVGTNGEIVVGNRDWMTCAACSAGPAFEGGGVKFGMRAAPGAIDQFYYDQATQSHRLSVIDQDKPVGICGSGLINIVAELLMAGILDAQGKFVKEKAPALVRDGEDGQEYILCPKENTAIDRDLVLTEIDVENLIRAKGAMYSGYQTLLESVGLTMNDLEKVIIGGGFGKSLNLANAITIGFLPELPVDKFTYIGNSSLTGAALAAMSGTIWRKAIEIKNNMTNFELSETPGYMDYYMGSQFLPHTQKNLFPETMARLEKNKKS